MSSTNKDTKFASMFLFPREYKLKLFEDAQVLWDTTTLQEHYDMDKSQKNNTQGEDLTWTTVCSTPLSQRWLNWAKGLEIGGITGNEKNWISQKFLVITVHGYSLNIHHLLSTHYVASIVISTLQAKGLKQSQSCLHSLTEEIWPQINLIWGIITLIKIKLW